MTADEPEKNVAESKTPMDERNGDWVDSFGCCKLCDGEIPYGHLDECRIWKLERELAEAKAREATARAEALEEAAELCDNAPVDKARCRVLHLPEQAWEEAQYDCAERIRTLKERAAPQVVMRRNAESDKPERPAAAAPKEKP